MKDARELRLWITQKFCRNSSPINLFDENVLSVRSNEVGGPALRGAKTQSYVLELSQKMQVGSFFGSLRTSQTIEEHIKFVEPKCLELRVYSFDLRLCYSAWFASPRLLSSLRNLYE